MSVGTSNYANPATYNQDRELTKSKREFTGMQNNRLNSAASPERDLFSEGYDTAMFAQHQLQKLATGTSSNAKKPPTSMKRHRSSIILEEEDSMDRAKAKP